MTPSLRRPAACALAAALLGTFLHALPASNPEWNRPVDPIRIAGPVYYVGTNELAAFLVASPQGHALIDGGFEDTAPLVLRSIRELGFEPREVRALLTTQAHFDHVGSLSALARATGARVMVMEGDAALVERGGRGDFAFGDEYTFPPVKVDRVLHDGDTVTAGPTTLVAHRTPGHTQGCTTWTMEVEESGRALHVTVAGSLTVNPPVRLVNRPSYPGIADDYAHSVQVMRGLPTDVFLAAHAQFFDFDGKAARLRAGASVNPFIDPGGYRAYLDRMEQGLRERIERETR